MEESAILSIWKSYSQQLEKSLELNRNNAIAITQLKVNSLLSSMKPIKIFTIGAGLLWVVFVDTIILHVFHSANPFFLVSAIVQVLLTKLAIGIYLYQLSLIAQVDPSGPVLATQDKLARLKITTLWVPRLLFLQLPLWTVFYWNESMLTNGNMVLYLLQAVVTGLFIFIAGWLFVNIKYQNRHKKWFGRLFNGREWTPLMKSMSLLQELSEYKQEPAGEANKELY